jgi:hypothetical protein
MYIIHDFSRDLEVNLRGETYAHDKSFRPGLPALAKLVGAKLVWARLVEE